jgi:hypothetical protein
MASSERGWKRLPAASGIIATAKACRTGLRPTHLDENQGRPTLFAHRQLHLLLVAWRARGHYDASMSSGRGQVRNYMPDSVRTSNR